MSAEREWPRAYQLTGDKVAAALLVLADAIGDVADAIERLGNAAEPEPPTFEVEGWRRPSDKE